MATHPFAIKLENALMDAIRLRDRMRDGMKPKDNGDGTFGVQKTRNRTVPVAPGLARQIGSSSPLDLDVQLGRAGGGSGGDSRPCEQKGNDRFAIRAYLDCRCKKGDRGACTALAAMSAQNNGASGGGGGGGV